MKRQRIISAAVLAAMVIALAAAPTVAQRPGRRTPMEHPGMGRGLGPEFTTDQKEAIQKIHEEYNDEQAELRNKLKVTALKLKKSFDDGEPDFDVLEDGLQQISSLRLELTKLRLRIHEEIRPLLDDDQRVLFDRGLARRLGRGIALRGGEGTMHGPGQPHDRRPHPPRGGMGGGGRGRTMGGRGGFMMGEDGCQWLETESDE